MIKAYIGKMRSGKTYKMTQDVLNLLDKGEVVYVNYAINWNPDREVPSMLQVLQRMNFLDIVRYPKENLKVFRSWEDVKDVGNCTVALDEGWLYFDSYQKLSKDMRRRLMQSGKRRMDLLYTTQRPMQADINLRWATDEFILCKMINIPFLPPYFIQRHLELYDNNEQAMINYEEPLRITREWANKKVMNAYDTLYEIYETEDDRILHEKKFELSEKERQGYIDNEPLFWENLFDKKKKVKHKRDIHKLSPYFSTIGDFGYNYDGVIPYVSHGKISTLGNTLTSRHEKSDIKTL